MLRRFLPILILLAAGCARSEDATLVATDSNQSARTVEQVRPERDDEEPALGQWREALQGEQHVIEFGPTGAPPLFSIGCDSRRGLLVQRHGLEPTGDLPVMLVTAGSETRRLAVTGGDGPIPMLRATLNGADPLAANMGRAAAPITVRIGDSPPLILPPSPLVGTYVARCSGGELPAPAAAQANTSAPAAAGQATANAVDAGD
ncbi:MAG: hypothetical protein E6G92_14810 [Alphaproteobacteria bacterium]|nr:MAG: hypothetical protein E6G92_14810 [Alphaproteobacteria bacterium]